MKKIVEKLIPSGHRLLVRVDSVPELKKSAIHIPDSVKDRESCATETGVIVAVGESAFVGFGDDSPWGKVGDRICFIRHAGHLRKVNNEDYRIINDVDMLCVIEDIEVEDVEGNTDASQSGN